MSTSVDIAAFVEAHIAPRFPDGKARGGSEWIAARCPAHPEKNASFAYNRSTGGYRCQACGVKGGLKKLCALLGIEHPFGSRSSVPRSTSRIAATYPYRDENGETRFEAVRLIPKRFQQRRPNGAGGWVWNLRGVSLVPYRLPELLSSDPAQPVFVVEGEKDADALAKLGLVATTNPMGAGKWRDDFARYFRNRTVVVIPDNDHAGGLHALQVARSLYEVAAVVKVVTLPDLPPKGDASDWLHAGGTSTQLEAIVDATAGWMPERAPSPLPLSTTESPHDTDLGNAKRLVARHGADLRHCSGYGGWFVWDGQRWCLDNTGEVMRRAKDTVLALYAEAAAISDDKARKRLVDWAQKSESERNLTAMVNLAASERGIAVEPNGWDADPFRLNVSNGTLDLRTGQLRFHSREDLITKLAPVVYDPNATHPVWDKFLRDATGGFGSHGDSEMIAFLQRFAGYTLTGDTSEEKLLFMHGPEASGKSTFLETLKATLRDYALTADFEMFLKRRSGGSPRNDIARLVGARLVVSIEVEDGKAMAEGVVKTLTGGDTVTARLLYKEFFEFLPQFKLCLAANHAPTVRDDDGAIWRRILRVPFEYTVPADERDPKVKAVLKDPARGGPAVLAWAVRGCLAWQREGLGVPPRVEAATSAYRADMDPLRGFLDERCVLHPGAWVPFATLWSAYEQFAKQSGELVTLTRREFGDRLTRRGHPPAVGAGGTRIRRGIGLLADTAVAAVAHSSAHSRKSAHEALASRSYANECNQAPLAQLSTEEGFDGEIA